MKNFFLFFLLSIQLTYGQVLVKKTFNTLKANAFSNKEISNVFMTKNNTYFSLKLSEKYIEETYSLESKFEIRDENNQIYSLGNNEYPIAIIDDKLYTHIDNVRNYERIFNIYKLSKGKKDKLNSLTLATSSYASVLESGDLIISEGHAGTDYAALYSKKLTKIHEFKPFNDTCTLGYDFNENYIAYAGQIETDNIVRIGLYGSFDSKGLVTAKEIKIDNNFTLASVKLVNESIVLLLSSTNSAKHQLIILNKNLEILKTIPLDRGISHNKIINDCDTFYISTRSHIYSISLEDLKLKEFIKKTNEKDIKTKYGYRFTGKEIFNLDDDHIILREAVYEDNVDIIENVKLKIIDKKNSKITQEITFSEKFEGDLFLKFFNKNVTIYAKNTMSSYEKQ